MLFFKKIRTEYNNMMQDINLLNDNLFIFTPYFNHMGFDYRFRILTKIVNVLGYRSREEKIRKLQTLESQGYICLLVNEK